MMIRCRNPSGYMRLRYAQSNGVAGSSVIPWLVREGQPAWSRLSDRMVLMASRRVVATHFPFSDEASSLVVGWTSLWSGSG